MALNSNLEDHKTSKHASALDRHGHTLSLSGTRSAAFVAALLLTGFLSGALLWNAGQMWKHSQLDVAAHISGSGNSSSSSSSSVPSATTGAAAGMRHFSIASFNVAGGYDSSGMDNVGCVGRLLQGLLNQSHDSSSSYSSTSYAYYWRNYPWSKPKLASLPLMIGLQESEASVTCHACHREIVGALARRLHLHAYDSTSGQALLHRPSKAGLGTLSMLPFRQTQTIAFAATSQAGQSTTSKMGLLTDNGVRRFFTHTSVSLLGTAASGYPSNGTLSLLNTQTSFSLDGASAKAQIAELAAYAAGLQHAVVITGDWNLFADGHSLQMQSTPAGATAANHSAWAPLLAGGFRSVTPIAPDGLEYQTEEGRRLYYGSPPAPAGASVGERVSTVHYRAEAAERPGYQTDYIWYRAAPNGGTLTLSTHDVNMPSGWRVRDSSLSSAETMADNLGLGRWAQSGAPNGGATCSHHRPLVASFVWSAGAGQ